MVVGYKAIVVSHSILINFIIRAKSVGALKGVSGNVGANPV